MIYIRTRSVQFNEVQYKRKMTLHLRHNGRDNASNHQPHDCLLNRLFRRRSKKTSKLRVTGLCVGNTPGTGEFPAQMASNAENVSIWWRHSETWKLCYIIIISHFEALDIREVGAKWHRYGKIDPTLKISSRLSLYLAGILR